MLKDARQLSFVRGTALETLLADGLGLIGTVLSVLVGLVVFKTFIQPLDARRYALAERLAKGRGRSKGA